MVNEIEVIVSNIFFLPDATILIVKGLDQKYALEKLECSLFINDIFLINILFKGELFMEKKRRHIDERAFECKQNLDQLREIDLGVNVFTIKYQID